MRKGVLDGYLYSVWTEDTVSIHAYLGPAQTLVIPNEIEGMPTTSISSDAFAAAPR